jgi:glycine/D-amino acid oxidase-like deaminating enzyme
MGSSRMRGGLQQQVNTFVFRGAAGKLSHVCLGFSDFTAAHHAECAATHNIQYCLLCAHAASALRQVRDMDHSMWRWMQLHAASGQVDRTRHCGFCAAEWLLQRLQHQLRHTPALLVHCAVHRWVAPFPAAAAAVLLF